MIYKTISLRGFQAELEPDFSSDAAELLFNYYNDTGEDMELDVVAIRTEWNGYDDPADLIDDYANHLEDISVDEDADEDDIAEALADELEGHTTVLRGCGCYVVMNF